MIQDFFKWTQLEIRVKETFSKKLEALKEKNINMHLGRCILRIDVHLPRCICYKFKERNNQIRGVLK